MFRGGPAAGHQAAFRPRHTAPEQPLAVQLNKMPNKPDMGKQRKPRRRGSTSSYFKLCREFEEKGHCNARDCQFAHGKDMLDTRMQERE